MDVVGLLDEIYGRIPPLVDAAVENLTAEQLVAAPLAGANPVGWLTWHLARVEDHHISELLGQEQLWASGPWASTFGLEPDPSNTGYGHNAGEVRQVRPEGPDAIRAYLGAAQERTLGFIESLSAARLDDVVDRRWDPPVTLGVRLVSVADDCLQHAGQAAYARGLLGP